MAFTKIVSPGIDTTGSYTVQELNTVGVVTASAFSGPLTGNATGLTGTPNITVTNITAAGNVSIAGTLTYEDVTNIDSVGIITAQSDVSIADKIVHTGNTNTAIRFPAADTISFECAGEEILKIGKSSTELLRISGPVDGSTQQEFGIGIAVNDAHTHPAAKITLKEYDASDSRGDLLFYTRGTNNDVASTERLRITSAGSVGIGTDNPVEKLSVEDSSPAVLINATSGSGESKLQFGRVGNTNIGEIKYEHSNNALSFRTNDVADRLRIDSSGRLLQGKNATKGSTGENVPTFCTEIASNNPNVFEIANNGTGTNAYACLVLSRSDSTSVNGHTAVDDNDKIGEVCFIGADGSDRFNTAAAIRVEAAADFTANNCPADLIFSTNGGLAQETERLRITSDGKVGINCTPTEKFHINGGNGDKFKLDCPNAYSNSSSIIMSQERGEIKTTLDASGGNPGGTMVLRTRNTAGTMVDAITIENSQQVSINSAAGTHPLTVSNGGTQRFRITSGGNVSVSSGGSISVTDSNNNASGQASTAGAINCNLIRPYNNANASHNGVYFLSRNAVGGGAKSVGIVETGLRVGDFTNNLAATERIKLGTNGVITADTNTSDTVVANFRNDEVAIQIGVYGAGSTYPRQCTINATRNDSGAYPWLRLGGQDGIHFCSDLNNIRGNLNAYGEWRIGSPNSNLISTDLVHSIGSIGVYNTTNAARLVIQERSGKWISFKNGSGTHFGTISLSGSNVSYGGQSSDYRIKENVVAVTTGIDMVKQLRPVHFNYTADSGFSAEEQSVIEIGFIAHEFAEVCPHGVIGEKDAYEIIGDCVNDATGEIVQRQVYESQSKDGETWTETSREPKYQQIDFSKAVPVLSAALQEAIAKIETLEAAVAALQGS